MSNYLREPVWQLSQSHASCVRSTLSYITYYNYTENTNLRLSLINIGGDLHCHPRAIYLHIIWHPDDNENDFFLYFGQSTDLAKRLSDHMNPLFRIKHPSLHYYVWDSRPGNLSAFVILAYLDDIGPANTSIGTKLVIGTDDQLKINIAELWAALIFQTLPERELSKYMDPITIVKRQHLNVANPLWQGVSTLEDEYANLSKKERFTALQHGADDIARQYYHSLRDEFYQLKDSPNPVFRAYYHARQGLAIAALKKGDARMTAQMLEDLMCWREKVVHTYTSNRSHTQVISFGCFVFRISKIEYPEAVPGSTVFAQGFLYNTEAKECYCIEAQELDPARRLSPRITGSGLSRPYTYFVQAGGDKTAQQINESVDLLEGVKKDDIVNRTRRALPEGMVRWDK
jgi:hypothetical protein